MQRVRICNSMEISTDILNNYSEKRTVLTQRANLRKYNVRQIQMVYDKPS